MPTDDEIRAILRHAADKLKTLAGTQDTVHTMPFSAEHLEPKEDGWVVLGSLYDGWDRDAWDVYWYPETGERRMRKLPKLDR